MMNRNLLFPYRSLIQILLLVFYPFSMGAQELLFTNLNSEVQLPSQECYKILQDRHGYIWFSTDNGLCRYTGNQLTVFDDKNGLPEESVYAMMEDPSGRLWFGTSDNRILYYDKGKLHESAFNKAYQKPAVDEWEHALIAGLDMTDPENSYIANSYYSVRINRKLNKVYCLPKVLGLTAVFEKPKGKPFHIVSRFSYTKNVRIEVRNEKKTKLIHLKNREEKFNHWLSSIASTRNKDFVSVHNELIRLNPDLSHTIYAFPERILNLYVDKSNGLWVAVRNNGVYYYPDVNSMKLMHHSLNGYSVTGICEDNEQGIWCSTLERGVFYSKNKYLKAYNAIKGFEKTMSLLKFIDGIMYAASSKKEFFSIHGSTIKRHAIDYFESEPIDIERHKKNWVISCREYILRMNKKFAPIEAISTTLTNGVTDFSGAYKMIPDLEGNLLAIDNNRMHKITDQKNSKDISGYIPFNSRKMMRKNRDELYLGGKQGLYIYNLKTLHHRKVEAIPEQVSQILRTRSGRIWITTKNHGIFWMDGDKIVSADEKLKLKTHLFFDITEDQYGTIWAGSNMGLHRFSGKGDQYESMLYTTTHGLPSNEVLKVAAGSDVIWFSTYEGLFNLSLDAHFTDENGPQVHLQKLSIHKKEIKNPPRKIKLPYVNNNCQFTFDILTFKKGATDQLEYELTSEKGTNSIRMNSNEISLANLSAGFYQLTVYGIDHNNVRSSKPEVFQIEVLTPFWQTWWFILSAVLLVALLVFIVVRMIIRNIQKGEEAKTLINKLMAEYQITALQAQMNPHFIFNAINTIQGYILERKEEDAYGYLAKFSKLIRMVLHNSQEKLLSLEQELKMLNLYIELEQLRFDNRFDYLLLISEEVETEEVYIPGMLLQPYIENAIWHGIVNLENSRRGKLTIEMTLQDELLKITITDNGVGREMSKSFKKDQHHKSVGLEITGKRLEVMNQLYGEKTASVAVTDLFDNDRNPAGTKVEITIPINI